MAGGWKTQNRKDTASCANAVADSLPLLEAAPKDRIPAPNMSFNLDQDDRIGHRQPDVCRCSKRSRDTGLSLGSPPWMTTREDPLDDPEVSAVVEPRRGPRIDVDPEVRSEGDRGSSPDLESHGRIAGLELADDRSGDSDDSGDVCLADTQAQSELTKLPPNIDRIVASDSRAFPLDESA
jgi:hypothetical protein